MNSTTELYKELQLINTFSIENDKINCLVLDINITKLGLATNIKYNTKVQSLLTLLKCPEIRPILW